MIRPLIASLLILAAAPAFAQSSDTAALVSRIERLERDLRDLRSQVYRGGSSGSTSTAAGAPAAMSGDVLQRFDTIEAELQRLTGRMEELQHGIDENKTSLERLSKDVDFRLRALEGKGGAAAPLPPPGDQGALSEPPPAAPKQPFDPNRSPPPGILGTLPPGQAAALPPAAPPPPTAMPQGASTDDQYKTAFNLMKSGDYAEAEPALQEFVRAHPRDEHAADAQYWLGRSYYVRGAYQEAANAFLDTVKSYGDGPKGPEALLYLGMSLNLLNQKDNACATLKALPTKYPKAPQAIKERSKQEAQRAKCG